MGPAELYRSTFLALAAAPKVARLALSEQGYARYQEIRAAADVYAKDGAETTAGAVPVEDHIPASPAAGAVAWPT